MNQKALQLLARFSLPPNHLGYCGHTPITEQLITCITKGESEGVLQELPGFISQLPYLKTIADVTQADYLDYNVVEAYWLGNDLLTKFKPQHYQLFMRHVMELELPDYYIHAFMHKQPSFFIPFHSFSVRVMSQLPQNSIHIEQLMNQCMINCQTVTADMITQQRYYPECDPKLKIGDMVAVHWNMAIKHLTNVEQKNLNFWNEKIHTLSSQ